MTPSPLVAARAVAKAFAKWQTGPDQTPDEDLLNALHDLCDSQGADPGQPAAEKRGFIWGYVEALPVDKAKDNEDAAMQAETCWDKLYANAAPAELMDVEVRRAIRHAASAITRHTNDANLLVLANKIHRLAAHPGSASTGAGEPKPIDFRTLVKERLDRVRAYIRSANPQTSERIRAHREGREEVLAEILNELDELEAAGPTEGQS